MSWREQLDIIERDMRAQARRKERSEQEVREALIIDDFGDLDPEKVKQAYARLELAMDDVTVRGTAFRPNDRMTVDTLKRASQAMRANAIAPEMIGGKAYYTERVILAGGYLPVHRYEWGLVAQLGPQSPLHFLRALIRTIRP